MKRLSLGLILVAVLGCPADNLAPLGRDFYALESVAGIPLPAPYAPNADYNELLVADSISFREDGTGTRRGVYQAENSTERYTADEDFLWTRDNNTVAISFVCPPNGLGACIAGPHLTGTVDGSTLTITDSKVTRLPLVYHRSGIERLESRRPR